MLILSLSLLARTLGFSAKNQLHDIKSAIVNQAAFPNADATTIPFDTIDCDSVNYSNNFVSQIISRDVYTKCANSRHEECLNLFDRYKTSLIRCEVLDETSLNVRWNATWIPVGSSWLYDFATIMNWKVTSKSPDAAKRVVFSWKNVFGLFSEAFATGNIVLPISLVEGSTIVRVTDKLISVKESIELVAEADKNRLQNRRVAQELASWLDVKRPPGEESSADEWASAFRQRILSGVAGAGALDVDPNESIFSAISVPRV